MASPNCSCNTQHLLWDLDLGIGIISDIKNRLLEGPVRTERGDYSLSRMLDIGLDLIEPAYSHLSATQPTKEPA